MSSGNEVAKRNGLPGPRARGSGREVRWAVACAEAVRARRCVRGLLFLDARAAPSCGEGETAHQRLQNLTFGPPSESASLDCGRGREAGGTGGDLSASASRIRLLILRSSNSAAFLQD